MIRENELYYRDDKENHKLVIHAEATDLMKQKVLHVHNQGHVSQDKTEEVCNSLYFHIPRTLLRQVVSNCLVCKQACPLKTKNPYSNIVEKNAFDRIQVDCMDLTPFQKQNEKYKWILSVIQSLPLNWQIALS